MTNRIKSIVKGTFAAAALCLFSVLPLHAAAPEGYYSSLDGKSGSDLWAAVKAVAKKNHVTISYGDNTWKAFRSTDVRIVNGKECWWDMYSSNNVSTDGHDGMNIEHSVANSWWGHTKNEAYKDIVHLNPSDAEANNRKSNYPLGEIAPNAIQWDNGITFVGSPKAGLGGEAKYVYEPHDMYKGDFARVFMYMFVVYDDISWASNTSWMYDTSDDYMFKPWASGLLLRWSAADPVSEKEANRNDGIYKEQKNRNPFIDLPDLADYLWGSKKGQKYVLSGDHTPVVPDPDDPYPGTPDNPDDPAFAGKFILAAKAADIADGYKYVVRARNTHLLLSVENAGKYFKPTTESADDTADYLEKVPSGAALVTLEATAGGYLLKMEDASGKTLGYVTSSETKNTFLAEKAEDAVPADVTVDAEGTATIDFGSAGQFVYNRTSPRFTTYTTTGGFRDELQLFRQIIPAGIIINRDEDPDDSYLVEVWGNNILVPEGAKVFDLNGREVSGRDLTHGVYIVVKPSFRKAVKITI